MKQFRLLFIFLFLSSTILVFSQNKATKSDPNIPIFEIKNDLGQTVFAVYPGGVKIFVDDQLKATGGGFTVGRIGTEKATGGDIFSVNPNDVRVNIDETLKATGGGFTVGRIGTEKASGDNESFLTVTPDSTRVYIDENSTAGFAVGKLGHTTGIQNFLHLTKDNYFIGHNSGKLTTGLYNLFLGYESGLANTTGNNNTFLGYQTGYTNTGGQRNVFIGDKSGYNNETGNYNTFVGTSSGISNIDGNYSTFIGYQAGMNAVSRGFNTCVGYSSGASGVDGFNRAYFGYSAGRNSTGSDNTYLGAEAGYYSGAGKGNVYIGTGAGRTATGDNNILIGKHAGYSATGSSNVLIGPGAGWYLQRSNILIIDNSSDILTPLIYGEFDNKRVAINSSDAHGYTFWVNGTAGGEYAWNSTSDRRLKTNIKPIPNALQKVLSLRGVNFNWKDKAKKGNKSQIGFIAQETEKVLPEVVNKSDKYYSMQYAPITAVLVEAVKEQQKIIEKLESKINKLEKRNETLTSEVSEIQDMKAEINELKTLVKGLVELNQPDKSKEESAN
jgi:hypothetical protein